MSAPTREEIEAIKGLVGVPLPDAYLGFLRQCNGGYPEVGVFWIRNEGSAYPWTVGRFYSLTSDPKIERYGETVLWNVVHRPSGVGQWLLPIAEDAGGNQFYIDLSNQEAQPVLVYIHDEPDAPFVVLAASFEDFIDGLQPDDEEDE